MQKTNFQFEILIHDDASTDGTTEIIKKYEESYPTSIFPVYQKENKYSRGIIISQTYNWPRARGKYLAFCEGDDYWTDPYKLQKQVDFLEANAEFGLVHTGVKVVDRKNQLILTADSPKPSGEVFYDLLLKSAFIVTCSVCARRDLVNEAVDHAIKNKLECVFDYWLWLHISMRSKIYYDPSLTSAYRSHSGGITQSNKVFFSKRSPLAVLDVILYKCKYFPEKKFSHKWDMYIVYWMKITSTSLNLQNRLRYIPFIFTRPLVLFAFFPAVRRKLKNKFSQLK